MNVRYKAVILTISMAAVLAMTACGSKQTTGTSSTVNSSTETEIASDTASTVSSNENEASTPVSENSNILIAYFSVMETDGVDTVSSASRVAVDGGTVGNNQYLASLIQQETGGDVFAIETVQDYPTTHEPLLEFAHNEKMEDARPELAAHIDNLDQYDVIFLGYPNWNADMPMPLYTFLEEYDFGGKTIIPFTSHGGSGFSGSIQTIESLQPNATVVENGLSISRNDVVGAKNQVASWVQGLGVNLTDNTSESISAIPDETEAVTDTPEDEDTDEGNGKTLVAYFSWSGNTREMASYIADQTDGDLFEIQPANPYPEDYQETGDVAKEERDNNARPEIMNMPEDISDYDTLFIGYPIWWHTAPMVIGTFLENYDLTGVEVYPFTQSASMDEEQFNNSMDFVRECANGTNVHDGLFVEATDIEGIQAYLTENGF